MAHESPTDEKHSKDEQLSTNQLSNGYTKASGMEDNNDSSRPYTHGVVMTSGMGSTCDTNEVLFFRG